MILLRQQILKKVLFLQGKLGILIVNWSNSHNDLPL